MSNAIKRKSRWDQGPGGKRMPKPSIPRPRLENSFRLHKFIRHREIGVITSGNVAVVSGGIAFALSDLPNPTEFTALFDLYKIDKIVINIQPLNNINSPSTVANLAYLVCVVDTDDIASPVTASDLLQYEKCHMVSPYKGLKLTWKPSVAMAAYGGSLFTSYANAQDQWIDMGSSGVPHYGFKYLASADGLGGTNHVSWRFWATYHFTCKSTR